MRDKKHVAGDLAEAIVVQHYIRKGWWVYTSPQAHQPADVIALSPAGEMLLLEVKQDSKRVNPGRSKSRRINRVLNEQQKSLNVKLVYVDTDTQSLDLRMT